MSILKGVKFDLYELPQLFHPQKNNLMIIIFLLIYMEQF